MSTNERPVQQKPSKIDQSEARNGRKCQKGRGLRKDVKNGPFQSSMYCNVTFVQNFTFKVHLNFKSF